MKFYESSYIDEPSFALKAKQILQQVRPYSMVPDTGVEFLIRAVQYVLEHQIPGEFVECGVWQGGCSAAIKLAEQVVPLNAHQRQLHLFDSFEGLPPVQPIDGPMACEWQQAVDASIYYDNCAANLELVQKNFAHLGLLNDSVCFHKGWFENTIPAFVENHADFKISLLRLDGDWYESTKVCLDYLYPLVSEKGVIIIDDYYAWDGCAVAVHEYLGKHRLNHRIRSLPDFSSAYILKQSHRED